MHCRIRGFIYVGLSSVGGCEHEVVSGLDQGHRRNDGFIEIIARGDGATTLNLDAGGVGTEYKNFAFGHCFSFLWLQVFLSPDYSSTRKIGQRRDFGIEDDPQTSRIPGASRS